MNTCAHFRHEPGLTYLNHGSFGAVPIELAEVQRALQDRMEADPVEFLLHQAASLLETSRATVAGFLGARTEDLVFTRNATAGIGSVLLSLGLRAGDELLTTNHRYDAVHNSMVRVARRAGATVTQARLPFPCEGPEQLAAAVIAAMGPNTRLLVLSQLTSPTALILPVAPIVEAARSRGIQVLIDGAHIPGHLPVDIESLGADWWVGNLHKWLCAPKGCAVLWCHPSHQAHTRPAITSHGLDFRSSFDWCGTDDPSPWLVAGHAVELHRRMGGPALQAANHALVQAGREEVAAALGVDLPHPDDPQLYGAMAAIPVPAPADRALEIGRTLRRLHRIQVPVFPWDDRSWVRISGVAGYNKPGDYSRLAQVLPEVASS